MHHSRIRRNTHGGISVRNLVPNGWMLRLVTELGYTTTRVEEEGYSSYSILGEHEHLDVLALIRILEAFTFDLEEALDGIEFTADHVDDILRTHVVRNAVTDAGHAMLACVAILGLDWDESVLTYNPAEIDGEERNALVAIMQAAGRGDVPMQLWQLDKSQRMDAMISTCNAMLEKKAVAK
jgi:hypothetical protein